MSAGEVIAVPTDTVYGLVCNFYNLMAVEKIFSLKNRPVSKPLVAFCKSIEDIEKICTKITDKFYLLAEKFYPGPLTIVLMKSNVVPNQLTNGSDTIGVRIPNYNFLNILLEKVDFPLASTSANLSDSGSFTNADDVFNTFLGKIPLVVDGGNCPLGIESTVIDISTDKFHILREGFIKKGQLLPYL